MKIVAVAVSGGRDSTALLHCTLRMARPLGLQVVALHVHHGLMPQADDWLARVRSQARRWGASFDGHRLAGMPAQGESVEAWARQQRYAALTDMAHAAGASIVLLAHHRRDQAETWLLQALRGGGPAGLAAMPRRAERTGLQWCRPWLDQPRSAIDAYVQQHRLRPVEDSSNADPRFARSRLRARVWPALVAAFPDAEKALAHSSRLAHEAAALAAECAAADLTACSSEDALVAETWRQLSPARRSNVLRHWLAKVIEAPIPETLVQRLMESLGTSPAASLRVPAPAGELRLYRGLLRYETPPAAAESDVPITLDLARPGRHAIPGWHAFDLCLRPCGQGGVALHQLRAVQLRGRVGSENFQRAPGTPPRSLKKQYQGAGLPAWQRGGPLLYTQAGQLLFVPGLGVDARCLAYPGEEQLQLQCEPRAQAATGRRQRAT